MENKEAYNVIQDMLSTLKSGKDISNTYQISEALNVALMKINKDTERDKFRVIESPVFIGDKVIILDSSIGVPPDISILSSEFEVTSIKNIRGQWYFDSINDKGIRKSYIPADMVGKGFKVIKNVNNTENKLDKDGYWIKSRMGDDLDGEYMCSNCYTTYDTADGSVTPLDCGQIRCYNCGSYMNRVVRKRDDID